LPTEPVLLALDPGGRTGWAVGSILAGPPRLGSFRMPDGAYGLRFATFENELLQLVQAFRPRWVLRAMPLLGKAGINRSRLALGWDTLIESVCYREQCVAYDQPEGTIRKNMLGRGSGRSEVMKALAIGWCEDHGIAPRNDDEADAAVVWCWGRDELYRQRRHRVSPRE
jgi:hypothetical protein